MYRGISDFKKGYQHRTNIVKDLVRNSQSILARWRNHFSQLFNVHGVSDVRHTEIHTAEPVVPDPSLLAVGLAIENYEVTNNQQNLLRQGVEQFAMRSTNLLFLLGIWGNCLSSGRSRSLHLFTRRTIKQIVVITGTYHFCLLRTKFYPASCCQG